MGRQAINVTKGTVVAREVKMADSYFKRLVGLMGSPGLPDGHGLWIVPCKDIHSCFMRFLFDAVFVDKTNTVVHVVENMKPWRMSKFVKSGHAVLELPGGAIATSRTEVGDQLELKD